MNADYFRLYSEYTSKYGKKTAIMMEIGSFMELLDEVNIETGESKANVREIADILGLQISIKRRDSIDELMCGIPEHTLHRWASKLTCLGWTVVLVTQTKNSSGKITSRNVTRVLSPSSHIESISSTDIPYLFAIVFTSTSQGPPSFGVAALDLTTGTTHTYVGDARGNKYAWTADEIIQMMTVFQAKEIIFYSSHDIPMEEESMRRQFCISTTVPIHFRLSDSKGSFSKNIVRAEYLQRMYRIQSLHSPRIYLGLRTDDEEYALLMLLQFAEEHFPSMVRILRKNESWQPNQRLICGGHSLVQLQVIGSNPTESVLGLFDKAISPMGKRAMKDRIVRPYSDTSIITRLLSEVSELLSWDASTLITLERQLRFMYDLPRLHRKMMCGLIQANEITHLFQTYRAMDTIQQKVVKNTCLTPPFSYEAWTTYLATFHNHFTEYKSPSCDQTILCVETYPDIGKKEKDISEIIEEIHAHRRYIAISGDIPVEAIRLEEREREPFGFKCSSIVIQQLKKKIQKMPEGTKFAELKSGGWIDTPSLQKLNGTLQRAREELMMYVHTILPSICVSLSEAGNEIWSCMESWIAHVDVTQCIGRVSLERGYVCPVIQSSDNGSSVMIQQMRHPLIESLPSCETHVAHDVELSNIVNGYLLHGLNGSGKTVFSKKIGICILLAQAGCFVPAKSMILAPFRSLFTRILNNDNIFSGLSTFGVEMMELREILHNASPYTMVLSDELCSGTESTSAVSIVASTMKWLSNTRTKYVFTTHFHNLHRLINPQHERVCIKHLSVQYDPVTQKLIYDRSLHDGVGSSLYGLEVSKAMGLPNEFIEQALTIRHQILGTTIQQDAKSSSWNSSIVRKECEICKSPITKELEVHHISERHTAKKGILPDGTHMNAASNLIVLCEECHQKVHHDTLRIGPMLQTSHGPERTVIHIEPDVSESKHIKKGKWTEEEMETVKTTLRTYSSLSLKAVRAYLSSKYGIEMSETVLARIKKEF
jgi:DNA mismatch repair protein MutS